jgi:PIN domain nuclease of toxin-antitoxin system
VGSGRGLNLILLDTHVLIWLDSSAAALGTRSRELCDRAMADGSLAISAISFWEVALLVARERIGVRLPLDAWRRDLLSAGASELPVDGAVGIRAAQLEQLHHDPADRIIVATALLQGARLLTADRRILDWPGNLACQDART